MTYPTALTKRRLRELADHLDGLQTGRKARVAFDINSEAHGTDMYTFDAINGGRMLQDFCGTVCCAIGSMPLSPYFRKDGFDFMWTTLGLDIIGLEQNGIRTNYMQIGEGYFGLSRRDTILLFTGSGYLDKDDEPKTVTPRMVANKIRKFINA